MIDYLKLKLITKLGVLNGFLFLIVTCNYTEKKDPLEGEGEFLATLGSPELVHIFVMSITVLISILPGP